jgi:hypothetical protein
VCVCVCVCARAQVYVQPQCTFQNLLVINVCDFFQTTGTDNDAVFIFGTTRTVCALSDC